MTRDDLLPGLGRLGFGTGWVPWPADPEGAVRAAYDLGIRYFDTARLYGDGRAEGVLARALKGRRGDVVLASKAGILPVDFSVPGRLKRKFLGVGREPRMGAFSIPDLRRSLERSLRELRTDHLDLLLLHEVSLHHVQTFDIVTFLYDQVAAGKLRRFGLATTPEESVAIARAFPALRGVVQIPATALDDGPHDAMRGRLLILHSIISGRRKALQQHLVRHPADRSMLSEMLGEDCGRADTVAGLLAGMAMANNPGGLALFASSQPRHMRRIVEWASPHPDRQEAIEAARNMLHRYRRCPAGARALPPERNTGTVTVDLAAQRTPVLRHA